MPHNLLLSTYSHSMIIEWQSGESFSSSKIAIILLYRYIWSSLIIWFSSPLTILEMTSMISADLTWFISLMMKTCSLIVGSFLYLSSITFERTRAWFIVVVKMILFSFWITTSSFVSFEYFIWNIILNSWLLRVGWKKNGRFFWKILWYIKNI